VSDDDLPEWLAPPHAREPLVMTVRMGFYELVDAPAATLALTKKGWRYVQRRARKVRMARKRRRGYA
jgi:hypothetical protein